MAGPPRRCCAATAPAPAAPAPAAPTIASWATAHGACHGAHGQLLSVMAFNRAGAANKVTIMPKVVRLLVAYNDAGQRIGLHDSGAKALRSRARLGSYLRGMAV